MVIAMGVEMVLACVALALVARGSKLCEVFTTLAAWFAVLLVLYVLGVFL